jgi:DNA-directed RNA polymerase specialized sigma54-like protein
LTRPWRRWSTISSFWHAVILPTLTRICGVDEEDLLDMLAEIRALDPKPGTRFETGSSETDCP